MSNILLILENPQINYEKIYEVMRDFRKAGLNPENYDEFIEKIKQLPNIRLRNPFHYRAFDSFNLSDITQDDYTAVIKEVKKRGIKASKICWHPEASITKCNVDANGEIIISAAHSIQENGVLSQIAESDFVMSYKFKKGEIGGEEIRKNIASIFWGFCNTHDSIFRPIENTPYINSPEQNFLFAYRSLVIVCHKKKEASNFMNYGDQSDVDIEENKKIFDNAILSNDFSIIESVVFELSFFYPIAVSSAFYLDYDFEKNPIKHSESRMENIFITLLPRQKENKTYFILSYFKQDEHLYGKLGTQLRKRNNLKSDITMLIGAHTDNVFFNPVYYKIFIEKLEDVLHALMYQTQMDHGTIGMDNKINIDYSLTPDDYLNNPNKISFFGY
jgi:hypothetical protein